VTYINIPEYWTGPGNWWLLEGEKIPNDWSVAYIFVARLRVWLKALMGLLAAVHIAPTHCRRLCVACRLKDLFLLLSWTLPAYTRIDSCIFCIWRQLCCRYWCTLRSWNVNRSIVWTPGSW
jgi:hypothetical protein